MSKLAVIVGVGPGIGGAVALRFAKEGFLVALMSRSEDTVEAARKKITEAGGKALAISDVDATSPEPVAKGFRTLREQTDLPVDLLVYNAGAFERGRVEAITAEDFERTWKANCMGGFLTAKEVLPSMQQRKQGTIVFTGATASLRGGAGFSCLAVGKFGLRALAQSLARENQKDNSIHVAHVIIDGMVDLPRTRGWFPDKPTEDFLNPHAIAQEYWNLYNQHPSTWTLELDLRPHPEKF
eukprot:TRINITY_DN6043_c0_g1_i3.p1 TRINITY_DN6043_c0_g1~~TRINITY_DN6043_c0_g1_i3.p1  ORF type:complete len:240 (+),score=38.07 TRINITY_DN6043_c0_g1_i3:118-837(+)